MKPSLIGIEAPSELEEEAGQDDAEDEGGEGGGETDGVMVMESKGKANPDQPGSEAK